MDAKHMQRWIMHIDMDAFYASVEQMDRPEFRGKPLIVGEGPRSVVSAASYEARKFGIRSAMPIAKAKKLCPEGIYVPVRMKRYAEVSRKVMDALSGFSPVIEQASVDEAYLDATGLERLFGKPEELARSVRKNVREATGLTCSVGMAPVKFLAKIASDINKPDGLKIIYPEEVAAFLRALPIGKIPGVGKRTLDIFNAMGIETGNDVLRFPREFWERRLGKAGVGIWRRVQGIDPSVVEPYTDPKSESAEHTFAEDTLDLELLKTWLLRHAERVSAKVRTMGVKGRTVTLKLKFYDFQSVTRSRTLSAPTDSTNVLYEIAESLLDGFTLSKKVRLIGLGLSGFSGGSGQLTLFSPETGINAERDTALDKAIDQVRKRFGNAALMRGRIFENEKSGKYSSARRAEEKRKTPPRTRQGKPRS